MRDLGYAYVGNEYTPANGGVRFDVIGISRYTRPGPHLRNQIIARRFSR